jgi:hypothetical protein
MTPITANLKTYRVFIAMHHRCKSPKNAGWHRYGGRGIFVSEDWADFDRFLSDMGPQPAGMVLDRIDNDGPYSAINCRWVTPKESMRNTSRNRMVTAFGRTACVAQWAEETLVPKMTIVHRLNRGWDVEAAVMLPVGTKQHVWSMFKQMAPTLKRMGVL